MERAITGHSVLDISGRPKGAEREEMATEDPEAAEEAAEGAPEEEEAERPSAKRPRRPAGLPKPTATTVSSGAESSRQASQARSDVSQSSRPEGATDAAASSSRDRPAPKPRQSSVTGLAELLKRSGAQV